MTRVAHMTAKRNDRAKPEMTAKHNDRAKPKMTTKHMTMKNTNFPKLANMTDDEIFDHYDEKISEENSLDFIYNLMQEKPDTSINLAEMFESTVEFAESNIDVILDFADRMQNYNPEKYSQEYEFLELKLIKHAFDTDNEKLLNRCLKIITKNPVAGIETITMSTLYRLIYFRKYNKALEYSHDVWKPIAESDQLVGYPEYPFLMTIYLNGAEKEYLKMSQGDTSGWQAFNERMNTLGFDNERERIDSVLQGLTGELDKEHILNAIKKKSGYGFIELSYHFFRFMKSRYNIPFMHSSLLFDFIMKRSLFGKVKDIEGWFYIPYSVLDHHFAESFDAFLQSNMIEVSGKVWGLHYVYEFLRENDLISDSYYQKMLENLAVLKMEYLRVVAPEAWQLKFVLDWPESEANLLDLPGDVFETHGIMQHGEAIAMLKSRFPEVRGQERVEKEIIKTAKKNKNHFPEPMWPTGQDFSPENAPVKTGRNEACPCGSGKKYKKCCLPNHD